MDFSNKTFIIAGAGGIGTATAIKLNSFGGKIILMDVNDGAMNETLSLLRGENYAYHCDFGDEHQLLFFR